MEFLELLSPVGVKDGVLTCRVMELGAPDASGRRSPVATSKTRTVPASAVIAAVGEQVDGAFLAANGLTLDQKGRPVVDETMQTSVPGVFAVGDTRRGPATVVEAIADAARAAGAIVSLDLGKYAGANIGPDHQAPLARRGDLCADCSTCGNSRCLGCATVCETCAEVCPNRANVSVAVPGKRQRQIVHVDGMCNECGNCATFCPYDSRPYRCV